MRLPSLLLLLATSVLACSSDGGDSLAPPPSKGSDSTVDPNGADAVTLTIEPAEIALDVGFGTQPTLSFRARRTLGNDLLDATSEATWSVDAPALGSVATPGNVTLAGIGGRGRVTASWHGVTATAPIKVRLVGDVPAPDAPANASSLFQGAKEDTTRFLDVLYPDSGVIVPANFAALEMQWASTPSASAHRMRLISGDVLDVSVYTSATILAPPASLWSAIAATAPDAEVSYEISSVTAAHVVTVSRPRTFIVTAERVSATKMYAHAPVSMNGIEVLDLEQGTARALPTDSSEARGSQSHCIGCHSVSRDGRRVGFITGGNLGTLQFQDASRLYSLEQAPSTGSTIDGPVGAFNPLEETTAAALIVERMNPATSLPTLALFDPDSGGIADSDLPTMLAALPGTLRAVSTPDWSANGAFITYAACDSVTPVPPPPTSLGHGFMSLVESAVSYDHGSFHFSPPTVVVPAGAREANFRPSIGVNDSAVAFMRSTNENQTQDVFILRRGDGSVLPIAAGQGTGGFPAWGPDVGKRYAWLALSSARPYKTDRTPTRRVWITAIDLEKLRVGSGDPSAPAFVAPGQWQAHARPQWPAFVPD